MCKKSRITSESGAVMLEGIIITVLTVFILIWLLGLGFLYYQRYVTTIATNDAAAKIASTYNNPTSDIIMGYITTEELGHRNLYRNFTQRSNSCNLREVNEDRAECYVRYVLDKTNFSGAVKDVEVSLVLVRDSVARKHVELTSKCTYNTPFGQIFDFFGMDRSSTYSVVSCADCTDIADYVSTVNFIAALTNGTYTSGMGFVDSLLKMLNTLVKLYNHTQSR